MSLWTDHISFSQLTAAEDCPYSYYLLKMAGVESVENAFAQAGTLAHQLLASWAKGEVTKENLPLRWIEQFTRAVTAPFPAFLRSKGYTEKLFESILSYFESFDGFPGYDVLGVEKYFVSSLAGEKFIGIIDLILEDKKTGGLVLVDHKSCSLASFKKTRDLKYRQLLLYAKYCADEYGVFPERLCFNLFKEKVIDERVFDPNEYQETKKWAEQQVGIMRSMSIPDWFETKPEMFKCTCLCSCRNECPYGCAENHTRKKEKQNVDNNNTITAA